LPARFIVVGDEIPEIAAGLRQAAGGVDAVLVTVGLGPTADDRTRAALAACLGAPLELDPASLDAIQAYFAGRGLSMPDANRVQALRPRGSEVLPNPVGTAPGIACQLAGTPCFVMPGVPVEMRHMFTHGVLPRLAGLTGARAIDSRRLHVVGMGESEVGRRLVDLMSAGRNPYVGTTAASGLVTVWITAIAASSDEVVGLLDADEAEIRRRLGDVIFGREDDTLASVAGRLLTERRATVCTAESCTGGLVAKLLTDIAGSSEYFVGGVVAYANLAKTELLGVPADVLGTHGAVSEAVAAAMATGARQRFGATYALSVTGIAGPAGGSTEKPVGLVLIGLATPGGCAVTRCCFGERALREVIRERTAWTALNLLRQALTTEQPEPGQGAARTNRRATGSADSTTSTG